MEIMIVEDEEKIAKLLVDYFEREGFRCRVRHEGVGVVEAIRRDPPDFVILDLMLPGQDGLSICRAVRQFSQVPILMLTARVDEIDRLVGLELGADDYVCKPFSPREVVTRVKTIMRRVQGPQGPTPSHRYGNVSVFKEMHLCSVGGVEVELTPVEFRMLCVMISFPQRVFSRQQLMNAAYDDQRTVSDRTVDSHVKNLRKKLSVYTKEVEVRSIYGVGYKLS